MAKNFWLLLIVVLAIVLRVWQLDVVPPALFGDELDVGYQAYSILKTGKDYQGQFLPTYIHSLAEWRAPLFIYSAVPFVAAFGLNDFGVRAPAVFFGILNVLLLYFLVKELFGEKLALLASFFLTITPWHLHYSRAAFEVTLLLSLFLGGVLCLLRSFKKQFFLLFAAIFLALTPYTYSTANLFLPLLVFFSFFIFKEQILKLSKKWIFLSLLVALIILLPFVTSLLSGQAGHRFGQISIFADEKLIEEINLKQNQGQTIERLFHNKATTYGKAFITNYLTSFSPAFLFLSGDPNYRQGAGEMGELYLSFLPIFLLGLLIVVNCRKEKRYQLLFVWLLVSPIPSALTQGGGNHATRLFLMLPVLVILAALGFMGLWQIKRIWLKSVLLVLFTFGLLINVIFYFHRYHVHYTKESWRLWQYGYKEPMLYIKEHENEYQKVLINSTYAPALLRFLFWTQYDPSRFQKEFNGDLAQREILPYFDGFNLGKYYFGTVPEEENFGKVVSKDILYLALQKRETPGDWDWSQNPPSDLRVLFSIKNPVGEPLFYLVTGK